MNHKATSAAILAEIDQYCQTALRDAKRRTHLGASIIGGDCLRKIWYEFRWADQEYIKSQTLRLFNRGHLEEARFVNYLTGIGCLVAEYDPSTIDPLTGVGKQFRVIFAMGHGGGSMDGQAILPPKFGIQGPILLEFKTKGTKYFPKLKAEGVRKAEPQHAAQMDVYGFLTGLTKALYMSVDKNTDEIYPELLDLDPVNGAAMVGRAHTLVIESTPPARAYAATHFKCEWCKFKGICHQGKRLDKNCRTCVHSQPCEEGTWFCHAFPQNGAIPPEVQEVGCPNWSPLNND